MRLQTIFQPGAALKFKQYKAEGCEYCVLCVVDAVLIGQYLDTDFVALGHDNNAWNVVSLLSL